jgi:hypothetical protein
MLDNPAASCGTRQPPFASFSYSPPLSLGRYAPTSSVRFIESYDIRPPCVPLRSIRYMQRLSFIFFIRRIMMANAYIDKEA